MLSLKGSAAMRKRLERIASRFPDKIKGALRVEAELIMTRSKREFVPVDLGTLRSSGHVHDPERRGDVVEVTMSYGGAAAPYALAVHETPSEHDPPSWRGVDVEFSPEGRGPKYLERPLDDALASMDRRIAKRLGLSAAGEPASEPSPVPAAPGRRRDSRGRFI